MLAVVLAAMRGCRKKPDPATVTIGAATWRVELATTGPQRYRGLSWRQSLPDDAGMLFVYEQAKVLEFCMRECFIPLDIAFIDSEHRVIKIHTMAVEADRAGRKMYSSGGAAQFALEVNGGSLRRAGVKVGDRVTFSADVPHAAAEGR